jgi:hypothetical protein
MPTCELLVLTADPEAATELSFVIDELMRGLDRIADELGEPAPRQDRNFVPYFHAILQFSTALETRAAHTLKDGMAKLMAKDGIEWAVHRFSVEDGSPSAAVSHLQQLLPRGFSK